MSRLLPSDTIPPLPPETGPSLPPRVLTVAGSDSGGGAGIQADLKTFFALGAYGMTAVTAVTVQDTRGVKGVHGVPAGVVAAQIEAVGRDVGIDAVKTGMLWSPSIVRAVAAALERLGRPTLVVDPVLAAHGGDRLLAATALSALARRLLPLATVVTPNIPEAEALSGLTIRDAGGMREAARRIAGLGPRHVVITGGHLVQEPADREPGGDGAEVIDLLYDGVTFREFRAPRLRVSHTHGGGCTFSAATAVYLARGLTVAEAVGRAKEFVRAGLARGLAMGRGRGTVNHWAGREAVTEWNNTGRDTGRSGTTST